jgi:hypothetical protein
MICFIDFTYFNPFHSTSKFGSIIASSSANFGGTVNIGQFSVENGIFFFFFFVFIYLFPFHEGMSLRVVLNKFDQFVFTQRTSKMSFVVFFTNLISNIPALMRLLFLIFLKKIFFFITFHN